MNSVEEENFPRGCKKVNVSKKRPKQDDNLFHIEGSHNAKKSKKVKKSHKVTITEDIFHNSINVQGTLSYSKIQEGMILLGCIRHITNFALEIELPGLTFGLVHITNISDIFTKHLSSLLEENKEGGHDILRSIFKVGQFVCVRVLSIENGEKGTKVKCSLKPSDINNEKIHSSFKKGMLIWGCIQSVLEHGYEVCIGVKNCRVFLPSKNVDGGKDLTIGEPMWFTIHKSESTNSVTTLRVSIKSEHIKDTKIEEISSLHDIIPGMQMEILTEKITSHGIQGKFINNYFGYIDQSHLKSPLHQLNTYKEGRLITAFVLFIEPSTKITHFTLRNLDPVPPPSHPVGDVITAKVICPAPNGIYLKPSTKEKCFVTNKRLIHALSKTSKQDISQGISTKFQLGSSHNCRILDYNHMSMMYICAVDQVLVKEKMFSSKDLSSSQLLTVVIDSVKTDGIVVVSGHIRGFVPNLHISNAEYSETLKKKFKPGDKVHARVLFVRDENVIFTLKSGLVESDKCLTSLEQAKRGDQYTGVVVKTKPAGALVTFYNNVMGWLNKQRLVSEDEDAKPDPAEYFYTGQVINPWVLGVKGDKVILTLKPPSSFNKQVNIKIGQRIRGIIGKIHKNRVDIKSRKGVLLGIVPVNHLSSSLSLCASFLKTFKTGDVMPDLLCVNNKTHPFILSRREALANSRSRKIKIKTFENLNTGVLLRCSYVSSTESGIYVLPLILDHTEEIFIKNANIVPKGESVPKFVKDQSIVAKILSINHDTKDIQLTVNHSLVFDKRVETAVGYFSHHLGDLKYLRDFGYKHGWDICQYHPGERVICKVEQLGEEGGCLVSLPNAVKGLVPPHLCPENIKPGQSIEGVFLSQDFRENYVEICLRKDIAHKINTTQDGIISISSLASCMVENILIKNDYVLGVFKQSGGNKQLVYLPLYLQENDRAGCHAYYQKSKFKICVCGKVSNYLIGLSKKLFLTLEKQKSLIEQQNLLRSAGKALDISQKKASKKSTSKDIQLDISPITSSNNETSEEDENKHLEDTNESDESVEESTEDEDNSVLSSEQGVKRKRDEIKALRNIKFGDEIVKNFSTSDSITGPMPVLPGVSSFFNSLDKEEEDETSSDEEEEAGAVKKKKKLTQSEKAELIRQEEEQLSKIEKEFADPTRPPESAEQFERLLLANPNSSELWARYITFHIAATELDKARSVAKRALDTIDMTAVNEKFNIWISLLNLENLFGTKESFDNTFEDALKYNEPLDIYLNVIKMLSESEKLSEMEEKIKKVRNKYKQEPSMWLEVAKTYYSINKLREARNIKEAALKSIEDRKTQFNLIIRFATMEFKYGEEQQGAAIFETILSSDPKKVNVWIIYVDQLIKKGRIEQARKVLERSICQRLPLKNMKTLFLKFRMFEEEHGTPALVEAVKQKAAEYVASAVKN